MIIPRHTWKKGCQTGEKGSNSEQVTERLPFKFVTEAQGRTTEFKTLVCNFSKNTTIELHSGKLYETPKCHPKIKDV